MSPATPKPVGPPVPVKPPVLNELAVVSDWIGDGKTTATAWRPAILDDHPIKRFSLVGGLPDIKKPVTVKLVCTADVAADIQADPKYADAIVSDPVVVEPALPVSKLINAAAKDT